MIYIFLCPPNLLLLRDEKCIGERPQMESVNNVMVACWKSRSEEIAKYRTQPYFIRKELADAGRS